MIAASYRVVASAPATIRWQPVDQDGEPVTATGTPTVTVTRADGTVVIPTIGIVAGAVEAGLTSAQTATLDRLTFVWSLDAVVRGMSTVEVVGGVFLTVAEARQYEPSIADLARYSDAAVRRARGEVESMFDRACGHVVSFVPRFSSLLASRSPGTAAVVVPHYFPRAVRWARYLSGVAWTTVDITGGVTISDGLLSLRAGGWPYGPLEVGYEHGLDGPPLDVKRAAAAAIRRQLNLDKSAVDSRAISYQVMGGEVQRFPTPGLGPWVTGIPEVDEVLKSYRQQYPTMVA